MRFMYVLVFFISQAAYSDCRELGEGVFRSESGAEIAIWPKHPNSPPGRPNQGCGSVDYVFGELGRAGVTVPGMPSLMPPGPIPGSELSAYRYEGERGTLYVSTFYDQYTGNAVDISFRTTDLRQFIMHELVVYNGDRTSRPAILYQEHGTEWTFHSAQAPEVTGFSWVDENGDGVRQAEEPAESGRAVTLYRCGPPWGIAGYAVTAAPDGEFVIRDVEPGSYQIGTPANADFSPIFAGEPEEDNDVWPNGFSSCFDIDAPPIGIGLTL